MNALDYIRNGYMLAGMGKPEPQLPLTPAVFHILLALFGLWLAVAYQIYLINLGHAAPQTLAEWVAGRAARAGRAY